MFVLAARRCRLYRNASWEDGEEDKDDWDDEDDEYNEYEDDDCYNYVGDEGGWMIMTKE